MKIALVKWIDTKNTSHGWESESDIGPLETANCITIGFLHDENDECISLIGTNCKKPDNIEDQFLHRIIIPKACIKIRYIMPRGDIPKELFEMIDEFQSEK